MPLRPGYPCGAGRQTYRNLAQALLHRPHRSAQIKRLGRMAHFGLEILQHAFDAAAADVRTEELGREIRDLVSLVEDDGIGGPEDVSEPVLLQSQVGEQQG